MVEEGGGLVQWAYLVLLTLRFDAFKYTTSHEEDHERIVVIYTGDILYI